MRAACDGSSACSASTYAPAPPACWTAAIILSARVVLPDASGPKISMPRPFGTPPQPINSSSTDMMPVGEAGSDSPTRSPMRCRTIDLYSLLRLLVTASRDLSLSSFDSGSSGARISCFGVSFGVSFGACPIFIFLLFFECCDRSHIATELVCEVLATQFDYERAAVFAPCLVDRFYELGMEIHPLKETVLTVPVPRLVDDVHLVAA